MRIRFNEVEFSYSSVKVLNDICLDLEGSKLICILGPNGVGKSTLVHCINKLLSPQKGTVLINNDDVVNMSLKQIAKTVGFVPQDPDSVPSLTVMDVILLGRHPHSGWRSTDKDIDIVTNILRVMDIEDLALRYIDELSGGQRQRVFIARGLAQMPEVMLLDEPTSNLDIRHQLDVMELLRNLVDENDLQVIMISHDLNMSSRYADHVIIMKDGKIFAAGDPKDVITKEVVREVYGVESEIIESSMCPYVVPLSSVQGKIKAKMSLSLVAKKEDQASKTESEKRGVAVSANEML